ncbi:zinc ribbon domain-containing protein [Pantoea sp. 18069]|uniref:zinc ribbon domain-containing protein n=1 Tax=Pantoea sp. 18069 TaxID=2681415 RepID=UPI0034D54978
MHRDRARNRFLRRWAELAYKMDWSGGLLLAVPAHHTSQTCRGCGHVAPENRRTWQRSLCIACGHTAHADVVGAINVLERGQRLLACGEDGSGRSRKIAAQPASVKQEPAEATMQETTHAQRSRNPPPSRASGGRRPRWGRMSTEPPRNPV